MNRAQNHSTRAGFTLIELMAVILIISILSAALIPQVTSAVERAKVTACQANLREIGRGFIEYQTKYGRLPNKHTGVAFFASLIAKDVWEAEQSTSKRMFCPAVDRDFLTPGAEGIPLAEWYVDLDQLDGGWSSYAGRNTREYPLRKYPGSEKDGALVADDNEQEANHGTTTNVLWANNQVFALEASDLIEEGTLTETDDKYLEVGPGSPVEALQKLSLD